MWVIKLGGSLLGSSELPQWLEMIAQHSDGKFIIVPGGGIFADAVRSAQSKTGIPDAVAHQMAVMAMDQYGILLTGLNPALVTASSELEIAERGWQHRALVWLPSRMVCADESIPQNWDVTSDSLAAWLAGRLGAEHLLLVKSDRPEASEVSLERLVKDGLVDMHLGDYVVGQSFKTWVVHKQDAHVLQQGDSVQQLEQDAVAVRCAWN
ncbi:MAG TPA: uridylate kinase [Methylovorus sp.]|jgi:5-(aminomethyl)-3-furanmethanol phosphate kinase|nr:uridylate kinase [Methylovorus sp.]